jgi:hypothetical protein
MVKTTLEPITEESLRSLDILHLYDEVVEFNDYCAFLCDAVACLAVEGDCIDEAAARGLGRFSLDIKRGMGALKSKLKKIHEKEYAQCLIVNEKTEGPHSPEPKK